MCVCESPEEMTGGNKTKRRGALTQPELIVHVAEADRVVLPVPEEIQLSILPSEENLQSAECHRWPVAFFYMRWT